MRAAFAFLVLALAAPALFAASIKDTRVRVEGRQVLLSLHLDGALGPRFEQRLESGLPTTLLYRFELHRDRKRWWDQKLRGAELEVTAMYDAVSRTYAVHYRLDGKLIESRTLRDRPGLETALRRIEGLPVFDLSGLPREERLLIKTQAELGSRTLLSFIPVAIETDWESSPKFRPPGS